MSGAKRQNDPAYQSPKGSFEMVNPHGFYTLKQVCELTTLSATTIWRRRREGSFPEPVVFEGRIAWEVAAIHAWLEKQARRRLASQEPTVAVGDT